MIAQDVPVHLAVFTLPVPFGRLAASPAWFLPFPECDTRWGYGHVIEINVHIRQDHGDFGLTSNEPLEDPIISGGQVEIAYNDIITFIHEAVLSCYGVVDTVRVR